MRYFLFLPLFLINRIGRTSRTSRTCRTSRTSLTSLILLPSLSACAWPNLLPRNRVLRLLVWAQAAGKTAANRPFRYHR